MLKIENLTVIEDNFDGDQSWVLMTDEEKHVGRITLAAGTVVFEARDGAGMNKQECPSFMAAARHLVSVHNASLG